MDVNPLFLNESNERYYLFYNLFSGLITLFVFIIWVDRYCLWMFDVMEGYPLMHPLISLAHHSSLLWLLPIIGKNCLTILFFLPSASIIVLLLCKNRYALLLCVSTVLLWVISFFIHRIEKESCWLSSIKPLSYIMVHNFFHSKSILKIAFNDIKQIMIDNDTYNFFVMPEAVFNIDTHIAACDFNLLHEKKSKHLIFGASCMHNSKCYNALVWTCDGKLQSYFYKRHAMLLSERLPFCLNNSFMRQLYFNEERNEVTTSTKQREVMDITGVASFVPYICSELFFNEYPDDIFYDKPILVLVNDSIFLQYVCSRYICMLLQLLTQLKAIQWQREIVYVSYSQSFYVNKYGNVFNLKK
jgi:apolipoprotein N-acyltransferase